MIVGRRMCNILLLGSVAIMSSSSSSEIQTEESEPSQEMKLNHHRYYRSEKRTRQKNHRSNRVRSHSSTVQMYGMPLQSNRMVINMKGKDTGTRITFPELEVELLCFDIPLLRLDNKFQVGTGRDCITIGKADGDVTFISDTTSFKFDHGEFTGASSPSVLPLGTDMDDSGFIVSTGLTHSEKPFPNNGIVRANGCFEGASGSIRLSGFLEGNLTSAVFFFDYVYVIDFDFKTKICS